MELYRTVASRARPVRDKRQRLRSAGELVALGKHLMTNAETAAGRSSRRCAVQYRDGLMIALLAYRPVRKKNFAAMRLGIHVVEQHGRHWMLFSAAETKNRVAYQAMFPEALEDNLRHYLKHHRPVLTAGVQGGHLSDIDALGYPTSAPNWRWRPGPADRQTHTSGIRTKHPPALVSGCGGHVDRHR